MGRHFAQQAMLDKETQIVIDGSQRNGRYAFANGGIDLFRRAVTVRSDDGLVNNLALVGSRQAVLPGELAELLVGKAHNFY